MSVPAVNRTLDLIEAFSQMRRPMTVSMLAKQLELPTSSCHGIVKTLEDRGYLVELKNQGGYYFTRRFQMHAERIASYDPLPEWLRPALAALRDDVQETVLLSKLTGQRAVYLDVLESAQSVRYIAQAGDTRPLHASAVGKALLGALPPAARSDLIARLDLARHNLRTLGTVAEVEANVADGVARGWFMTQGEFLTDVTALAVSMRIGPEVYAVGVAGPGTRMDHRVPDLAQRLMAFKEQALRETA